MGSVIHVFKIDEDCVSYFGKITAMNRQEKEKVL